MLIDIIRQFLIFTGSVLAGIIIGLLFEVYKIIIKELRRNRIVLPMLDMLFWITSGILIYFWLFFICGAIVTVYVILLIIAGMVIYYFVISPIFNGCIEKLIYKIMRIISVMWNIITYPIALLCHILFKGIKKSKKE